MKRQVRLAVVGVALAILLGSAVWRAAEERARAEQTCATLVEAYRSAVAQGGPASVDGVRFRLEARHALHELQDGRCRELAALVAEIERSPAAPPGGPGGAPPAASSDAGSR